MYFYLLIMCTYFFAFVKIIRVVCISFCASFYWVLSHFVFDSVCCQLSLNCMDILWNTVQLKMNRIYLQSWFASFPLIDWFIHSFYCSMSSVVETRFEWLQLWMKSVRLKLFWILSVLRLVQLLYVHFTIFNYVWLIQWLLFNDSSLKSKTIWEI